MEAESERGSSNSARAIGRTRSAHLLRFLNSLQLAQPLSASNVAGEFQSGVLLCALVQHLAPDVQILGVNKKVLSKQPALANIEKALSVIWKRSRRAQFIPSAEEIYDRKPEKIYNLLSEIVEAFVLSDARSPSVARDMRRFYGNVMQPYGKLLSHNAFSFAKKGGEALLWEDFGNGTILACVLHRYITCKLQRPVAQYPKLPVPEHIPDLSRVYRQPDTEDEARANVAYVLELLRMNGLPCFWTVDEFFAKQRDDEFLLLQLHAIFRIFSGADPGPDPQSVQFRDENRMRGREQRRQRDIEGRRAELATLEGRRLEEELVKYAGEAAGPSLTALAESQERLRRTEAASPATHGSHPAMGTPAGGGSPLARYGSGRGEPAAPTSSGTSGRRALEQLSQQQQTEEGVSPSKRRVEEELFRKASRLNELEPKFEMLKTAIERRRAEDSNPPAAVPPGPAAVPGPLPSEVFASERGAAWQQHPYSDQIRQLEEMVSRADRGIKADLRSAAATDGAADEQARRVAEQVELLKAGEARLLAQVNRELADLQQKVALLGEQLERSRRDAARERGLRERAEQRAADAAERAARAEERAAGGAAAAGSVEHAREQVQAVERERAAIQRRLEAVSVEATAQGARASAYERRVRELEEQLGAIERRHETLKTALAAGQTSDVDQLRRENADLKSSKEEAQRETAEARREVAELRLKLERAVGEARREAATELRARTAAVEAIVAQRDEEATRFRKEAEEARGELERTRERHERATREMERLQESVERLRGDMDAAEQLKREHAGLARQADALRKAAAETAAERDGLAAQVRQLQARLDERGAEAAAEGSARREAERRAREAADVGEEGRERAQRLERRAAAATEEALRFEREAREADRRAREAARAAEEAIEALEAAERERDALRDELLGLREARKEMSDKMRALEGGGKTDAEGHRKAAAHWQAEAAAQGKAAEAAAARLEEMRRDRDRYHAESVALEYKLKMAQAQAEALEGEGRRGGEAERDVKALHKELGRAEGERKALLGEVEALRQELTAANKVVEQLVGLREENETLSRRLAQVKEVAKSGDRAALEALLSHTQRAIGSQGRAAGAAAKTLATPRATPRKTEEGAGREAAGLREEIARLQQENVALLQAMLKEPREERVQTRIAELEGAIARLQAENEELQWFKIEGARGPREALERVRSPEDLRRQLEAAEKRAVQAELRLAAAIASRASPLAASPRAPVGPSALSPRSAGSAFAAPGAGRPTPHKAGATPPPADQLVVGVAMGEGVVAAGLTRKPTLVNAPRPSAGSVASSSARTLPGSQRSLPDVTTIDLTDVNI